MNDTDLDGLHHELAGVARGIARLLVRPGHDEAELAELETRARDLRARIREAEAREEYVLELRRGSYGSRLVPRD